MPHRPTGPISNKTENRPVYRLVLACSAHMLTQNDFSRCVCVSFVHCKLTVRPHHPQTPGPKRFLGREEASRQHPTAKLRSATTLHRHLKVSPRRCGLLPRQQTLRGWGTSPSLKLRGLGGFPGVLGLPCSTYRFSGRLPRHRTHEHRGLATAVFCQHRSAPGRASRGQVPHAGLPM